AVEPRCLDQGVDCSGALTAIVGAGEQPVLATERDGAHGALSGVVVDFQAAIVAISGQFGPAVSGIADGTGQFALAGDAGQCRLEPPPEILEQRSGAALADRPAFVGGPSADGGFDVIEPADMLDRLACQGRAVAGVEIEEFAPDMGPAAHLG